MKLKEPIELSGGGGMACPPTGSPDAGVYVRLPDISDLGSLPLSGEITFCYKRRTVQLEGADDLSANVVLTKITAIKADPDSDDSPKEDAVDKLFAEACAAEENEAGES